MDSLLDIMECLPKGTPLWDKQLNSEVYFKRINKDYIVCTYEGLYIKYSTYGTYLNDFETVLFPNNHVARWEDAIGYKGLPPDLKVRNYQYKLGEVNTIYGIVKLCTRGLHYCLNPLWVFKYYPPYKYRSSGSFITKYYQILDVGNQYNKSKHKSVTNKLVLLKEIAIENILQYLEQEPSCDSAMQETVVNTSNSVTPFSYTLSNNPFTTVANANSYSVTHTQGNFSIAVSEKTNSLVMTSGYNSIAISKGTSSGAIAMDEGTIAITLDTHGFVKALHKDSIVMANKNTIVEGVAGSYVIFKVYENTQFIVKLFRIPENMANKPFTYKDIIVNEKL